ncbi:type II toxin-antitoxin system VapB family antitoxin [Salinarimonas sp.]|uniref:type II toxin-antitoxin system VapB family antitoxin n=1 Tax=Salinarimonas sp. TaxID=2766526 RepID=UPI00391C8A4C
MPLNIEDEEVTRQARELARLTGRSMTEVVRTALTEKLAAMGAGDRREDGEERLRRMLELGRRIRADLGPKAGTSAHDDPYDSDGIPS